MRAYALIEVEPGATDVVSSIRSFSLQNCLLIAERLYPSEVIAHISIAPYVTETGRPVTGEMDDGADPIEESLEAALDSLRNLMEGTGGKEEPATTA